MSQRRTRHSQHPRTADEPDGVRRAERDVTWRPGWEWLGAVLAIHALVVVPWVIVLGAWPLMAAAVSLVYHANVYRQGEEWRFVLVEETAVLFQPDGEPAALRGSIWMTAQWVVVPTSQRVLTLRARRYDADSFAMLRRALPGRTGAG